MKKIIYSLIGLLLATSFGLQKVNAQKARDSSLLNNKKVLPVKTGKSKVSQQSTTPVSLIPATKVTQTANGMIYTPQSSATQTASQPAQPDPATTSTTNSTPTVLPDIIVTSIDFLPNTANTYIVKYTLKNTGTAAVKKGLLSVQSNINGNAAGGAKSTSLLTEINQLLNPGESFSSSATFSTTGTTPNIPYAFSLCVNGTKVNAGTASEAWVGQQFPELNYTNNTIQTTFTLPPPPPAPADIEVTITSITISPADTASFVRIYYTLKNIGETAIPQNASLAIQTRIEDTDNDPGTFIGTACCGQPGGGSNLAANEVPIAPGEVKSQYFDARVGAGYYPALPRSASYKFNVEISDNNSFTDGNNANNKSSFTYFLQ